MYPIEYKHGIVRNELEYHVQLCAQGMCLEEMYACHIEKGAIFYIDAHRRDEILLTDALREDVIRGTKALSQMAETQKIPTSQYSPKCKKCSLEGICMPKVKTSVSYCSRICSIASDKEAE